ncbi:MAG: mevalonate kinase [Proteobacteria bacterium]|nr:mevalonate kinase [Pseudomonadota bacterium]
MTTGRAAGKVILVGEHAVVYGYPALAMGLNLGTTVRLTPAEGPTQVVSRPCDARLVEAIRAALPESGLAVEVDSEVPIGCGMGSSAALSVALVRAAAAFESVELTNEEVFERSLELEKVFHGTPSGLDNTVAANGGVIRFHRGPPARFERLPAPNWRAVVLESGTAGNTAELVAGVRERHPDNAEVLARIGRLVSQAEAVLDQPERLGPLLTENHRLLVELGVSTPRLNALVELALAHGALGAKMSGAGGGGIVLALVDDPGPLLRAAAEQDIRAHLVRPGVLV